MYIFTSYSDGPIPVCRHPQLVNHRTHGAKPTLYYKALDRIKDSSSRPDQIDDWARPCTHYIAYYVLVYRTTWSASTAAT